MLKHAVLSPGAGFEPFRALAYYTQRLLVAPRLRALLCRLLALGINLRVRRRAAAAAPPEALAALRRDGIVVLGPLLTAGMLDEVRRYLAGRPLHHPRTGDVLPAALFAAAPIAGYALEDILGCPHLLALANDPALLSLLRSYFGCTPTISGWGLRWSRPAGGGPADDVQVFHRDADDWRTVKLFIYLTEVGEGDGPHVYVEGSHREPGTVRNRPLTDAAVVERYGTGRIVTQCGPAGLAFLADTHGYHKGAAPRSGARLMLTVQYSLLPVFLFAAPEPAGVLGGFDRYVNRLFLR